MILLSVYNNKNILEAGLLASNPAFLSSVKLFLVNNKLNKFSSVSDAIHSQLELISKTETLVICHQDVIFYDSDSANKIEKFVDEIRLGNIFFSGLVGRKREIEYKEGIGVNNIISGGKETKFLKIAGPTKVESIDECVMITNRITIEKYNLFSDRRFKWHLYATDACLYLTENGICTYVLPIRINHLSRGYADLEFFKLARMLLQKYGIKEILTTNGKLTRKSIAIRYFKRFLLKYLAKIN